MRFLVQMDGNGQRSRRGPGTQVLLPSRVYKKSLAAQKEVSGTPGWGNKFGLEPVPNLPELHFPKAGNPHPPPPLPAVGGAGRNI